MIDQDLVVLLPVLKSHFTCHSKPSDRVQICNNLIANGTGVSLTKKDSCYNKQPCPQINSFVTSSSILPAITCTPNAPPFSM